MVPLYFRVSERFAIDAMLHRITQLPRGDRWDALARGALRDDLYGVLKSLTLNVIEATDADEAPADRLAAWATAHTDDLTRAQRALAGIDRLEAPTIAAMSVALRTLRSLVRLG